MSGPSSPVPPRRLERGGVSWVTLLLLAALGAGAYLGWIWIPLHFERYTVMQVVRDYMNQAIKNPDDEALKRNMLAKIRSLSQVKGVDAHGNERSLPAIDLDERQIAWERDMSARPPVLRVSFEYERLVKYPVLDRTEVKVFTVDLTNELEIPDWGPAR